MQCDYADQTSYSLFVAERENSMTSVIAQRPSTLRVERPASTPEPHEPPQTQALIVFLAKPVIDYAVAAVLFAILWPLILILMGLISITSQGSPLYRQRRLGRHGRTFVIFKLRTMYHDCERVGGIRWSNPGDPRVTPLGRILRKTHLDELPQLWNVLKGEMSLVGPRPERPEIVAQIENALPEYRWREALKPGITGLAQLRLPPDSDLDGVRHKLAYDLCYLRGASMWLDLRIILGTALKVLCIPTGRICWVLGLPRIPAEAAVRSSLASGRMGRVDLRVS